MSEVYCFSAASICISVSDFFMPFGTWFIMITDEMPVVWRDGQRLVKVTADEVRRSVVLKEIGSDQITQ